MRPPHILAHMKTPLRQIRERRGQTIVQVGDAVGLDCGNLSRIENCKQKASLELAEKLAKHFEYAISELEILYPERFMAAFPPDEPVAIVEYGKVVNQLQWLSPQALAQVPVGTKLFMRVAHNAALALESSQLNELEVRRQQALALLEQATLATLDISAVKKAIALLSQPAPT